MAEFNEKTLSHQPALSLLQALGYTYISPQDCALQRGGSYHVLLRDILRGQLRRLNRYAYAGAVNEFSASNIERAMEEIDEPLTDGLVRTSEKIYDMLMLGRSYPETVGEGRTLSFNLKYVDWEHPENNLFHATQEYSVERIGEGTTTRPDIVLFINGIPFAVIECKDPTVSVEKAIEQHCRNQQGNYIPQLYKFAQIVLAINKNAVKYATTNTPKKFWNVWKEQDEAFLEAELARCIPDRMPTEQDRGIVSLLSIPRAMELMQHFVLFDGNIKKIARYQQYFAVREIMKTVCQYDEDSRRRGGVIWHTQGSGKSLTMVMLAKKLLSELPKDKVRPRVVIVTDRTELDKQIAGTFAHTRLHPARATSGRGLAGLIREGKADIITSIINKFNTAEKMDIADESPDIFILIDESHRTNYGAMATKMRMVFPNACYIGFTGTPLLKKDKNTLTKFGGLIHSYTIRDGVEDGAIVPLIYEGRLVEQSVDDENIDLWFAQVTKRLTPAQREDLKAKWSSIRRLTSTNTRIRRIALDIEQHFIENIKDTGFKAMLATNYKRDAVRYLECFELFNDLKCGVVISSPDDREGVDDTDEESDDIVRRFWKKMMDRYGSPEDYEEALKSDFIAGTIDILIVVGKLLTGFDAPICQVLYNDRELKAHNLLQAIARTNRLCDGKDYGLIVDYRGLIKELDDAMRTYSGGGLDDFEPGDLAGVAIDVLQTIAKLRESYSQLEALFDDLPDRRDMEAVEVALEDENLRKQFYNLLCAFGKVLKLVLGSEKAYAAITSEECEQYQEALKFYYKIRRDVKVRYCDALDNSEYEPQMQSLLDTYLSVEGLRQLTNPIDTLNQDDFERELRELGTSRSKADAIRSRLGKSIKDCRDENPAYYDAFSERIRRALKEYQDRVIDEAEYLAKMQHIMEDYHNGRSDVKYPESIRNNVHAQAFYGVLSAVFAADEEIHIEPDFVAEIAQEITGIIDNHNQVDWTNNKTIHDRISQDIDDLFYRYEKERGLVLDFDTIDKIIENVKTVALRRF